MAKFGSAFDATAVDPAKPFTVLPAGKYPAQIVGSEMRLTKDGAGQYLWVQMEVLEGPHKGAKLFDRLNLVNASAKTVEIGQSTLSAICHATNRLNIEDSQELHLIPFTADVVIVPPKNGYGESNKVRYLPLESGAAAPQPSRPAAPQKSGASAAATTSSTAPWKR